MNSSMPPRHPGVPPAANLRQMPVLVLSQTIIIVRKEERRKPLVDVDVFTVIRIKHTYMCI